MEQERNRNCRAAYAPDYHQQHQYQQQPSPSNFSPEVEQQIKLESIFNDSRQFQEFLPDIVEQIRIERLYEN